MKQILKNIWARRLVKVICWMIVIVVAIGWIIYAYTVTSESVSNYWKFTALKKSANAGDIAAMSKLGEAYLWGWVGTNFGTTWDPAKRDRQKARKWLEKAAENGNIDAMKSLGQMMYMYENSPDDEEFAKKVIEWLEEAAENDNRDAMAFLGSMYLYGNFPDKEESGKKSIAWYEKAAGKGDRDAMYSLGLGYANLAHGYGFSEEKDIHKAIEWFEKAFDAGEQWAIRHLFRIYEEEDSPEKNEEKALQCIDKYIAFLNNANIYKPREASLFLDVGVMYLRGFYLAVDWEKAEEWFNKSVQKDKDFASIVAQEYNWRTRYGDRKDREKALAKAREWYTKAIEGSTGDRAQDFRKEMARLGKYPRHPTYLSRMIIEEVVRIFPILTVIAVGIVVTFLFRKYRKGKV